MTQTGELSGRRILVLEDELLVAMGVEDALQDLGCAVVGPFPTAQAALAVPLSDFDGAVLDVNLRGEVSFALADRLRSAGKPFILCSGYAEVDIIPERFADAPRLTKPFMDQAFRRAMETAFARAEA